MEWMEGDSGKPMPDFLNGRDALVWARTYSAEDPERCDCDTLEKALGMVPGAKRMVRSHGCRQRPTINVLGRASLAPTWALLSLSCS